MNENPKETFLTAMPREIHPPDYDFNDDDLEIDVKSSTSSSEDTRHMNTELDLTAEKKGSYERSLVSVGQVQNANSIENQM